MEYILQKIKSTHEKLMSDITQEFEDKIEYEQNVCYDQHKGSIDGFAECCYLLKKSA